MIQKLIRNLASEKQRLAALEAEVRSRLTAELPLLPGAYGFSSVKAFIRAVEAAATASGKPEKAAKSRESKKAAKPAKKSGRARITPKIKGKVLKLLAAGKGAAAIARIVRISVPSVYNIKRTGVQSAASAEATPDAKVAAGAA